MRQAIVVVFAFFLLAGVAQAQALPATPVLQAYPAPSATVGWPGQPTPILTPVPMKCRQPVVQHVATWGERGSGDGQFSGSLGIAYDTDRELVWVADSGNHRLQAFRLDGQFVRTVGKLGDGPGEFIRPADVAVLDNGLVLVSDAGNGRFQVLTEWGQQQYEWPMRSPGRLDVGSGGEVFAIARPWQTTVVVYDQLGEELAAYWFADVKGNSVGDIGLATASDANILYIIDNNKLRTIAYALNGKPLFQWYNRHAQYVDAIADGPGGLLFIKEQELDIYSSNGAYITSIPGSLTGVCDLAVAGTGPTIVLVASSSGVHSYRLYWSCPSHLPLVLKS